AVRRAVVAALRDAFRDHRNRDIAADYHFDLVKHELHRKGVVENPRPALHHGTPSREFRPSRMDTHDIGLLEPDFGHLIDVQALEGAVEGEICFEYGFAIGRHGKNETTDERA